MLDKILIANRGEIAVRVIRACRELGIQTVAVYSQADRDSLHVRLADQAVCIGPPPARESYLNMQNIICAALITGARAIHPGYGFLAENARFAALCQQHDLVFIGPAPAAMTAMGDKAVARATVQRAGVPVVPGSPGVVEELEQALRVAQEIGYPVLIKAAAGGGGRGMRVAASEEELKRAWQTARAEAGTAFGNAAVYLEKYIEQPRHVEIQVLGDQHGNLLYLGERDCTVQRRNQKLIEEAPSPVVTPELRQAMGRAALEAAAAVGYFSAGTVEFLVDRHRNFYFIEMNTRIQVEHPVTELITGVDLIKEQILVAAGEKLSIKQSDVQIKGHAIECRINAEDPAAGFKPCPGRISAYLPPGGPGVRVDSFIYAGYTVPPFYDSLLCKVVALGADRAEAICRMLRALNEMQLEGVPTTIPLHRQILQHELFQSGAYDTSFVQQELGL
ncbi:acetyl-CoA carboxylase biotin carboxylase subunit [Desulfurispora thermophila]|uniref:acetyl-CoA carboxylase biotin carboxylase subunit n=1 Tax=Desulfurispora thermophila TaxID=265470 RepID=UPI00036F5E72|nr:acetyl-CoA carboxylase biotin carboxylase subunit [Desulfurispora thermophila]